jgi:hypothetical protein
MDSLSSEERIAAALAMLKDLLADCGNCDGTGWVMNCGADPTKPYAHCDECIECEGLFLVQGILKGEAS